jgi:hypothetical protein
MANTITKTTMHDGHKNAVVHLYLLSDGSAGDITDNVLVDASALSPAPSTVRIMKLWWSFSGFTGRLEFDASTDTGGWVLGDTDGFMDFTSIGGIQSTAGSGETGDILLTTLGFAAATDMGTLIIQIQKD